MLCVSHIVVLPSVNVKCLLVSTKKEHPNSSHGLLSDNTEGESSSTNQLDVKVSVQLVDVDSAFCRGSMICVAFGACTS